jgi:hypothetical protein
MKTAEPFCRESLAVAAVIRCVSSAPKIVRTRGRALYFRDPFGIVHDVIEA